MLAAAVLKPVADTLVYAPPMEYVPDVIFPLTTVLLGLVRLPENWKPLMTPVACPSR